MKEEAWSLLCCYVRQPLKMLQVLKVSRMYGHFFITPILKIIFFKWTESKYYFYNISALHIAPRIGEGKRIKIEGKQIKPEIMTPSPPPNRNPRDQFDATSTKYYLSCPKMALKALENSLYFFHGLLAEHPDNGNEIAPIILDLKKRIRSLEDVIHART